MCCVWTAVWIRRIVLLVGGTAPEEKERKMSIKYKQVIPGMVVCHELAITIIKLYGNWNVQKNDQYVKGFNTLTEAKAFVAEMVGN